APLAGGARDGRVPNDRRGVLLLGVPVGERGRLDLGELVALRCARLLGQDLEQVDAVTRDADDAGCLADRRPEDPCRQPLVELALGDPAFIAAGSAGSRAEAPLGSSFGEYRM